jgi:hypothetical protein
VLGVEGGATTVPTPRERSVSMCAIASPIVQNGTDA